MPRSKVSSSNQAIAWPFWLRALGSVWCAAFLIATLAVILIASTTLESKLGTPRAQRLVYQSLWFDAFLILFALNLASSTILRWPFKKKHTGFIVTHIGILILLAGSLQSRLLGVEGQLALFEGERDGRIAANDFEIRLARGNDVISHPLSSLRPGQAFDALENSTELVYSNFEENAVLEKIVENDGNDTNAAIRIKLSSSMAGFGQSFWLVSRDPSDPNSATRPLGPAVLELRTGEPSDETPDGGKSSVEARHAAPLLFFHRGKESLAKIPVKPAPTSPVAVGSTGYKLQNIRYWPDARVESNNTLVSISEEPRNPAVEAELVAPDGSIVRLVRFTLFPDFESMHGKDGSKRPDFDVELVAGESTGARHDAPRLAFYAGKTWQHRFYSSTGASSGGVIEEGKTYPAGWMDFEFTVEKLLDRAAVQHTVRPVTGKNGRPAAEIFLRRNGQIVGGGWITSDAPLTGPGGTPLPVVLRQRMIEVPFQVRLKDFRKVDYPGTTRPASFESDVTLEDPAEGFTLSRTIRMNKPLDYKGFRIFQSSYIDDADQGEGSVFTVAKNPGIPLIYAGTIILFFGVFVTFFVPPFSSLLIGKN